MNYKIDCVSRINMESTDFLHASTNSHKLEGDEFLFLCKYDQKWVCQSGNGTLKLTLLHII